MKKRPDTEPRYRSAVLNAAEDYLAREWPEWPSTTLATRKLLEGLFDIFGDALTNDGIGPPEMTDEMIEAGVTEFFRCYPQEELSSNVPVHEMVRRVISCRPR